MRASRICSSSCNRSYDQSTSARSVCWRACSVRRRPSAACSGPCSRLLISATASERTRAAASSSASGMPSSRAHQLGDRRRLALGQREARLVQLRPLDEQLHGCRLATAPRGPSRARRHRQRLHRIASARPARAAPRGSSRGSRTSGAARRIALGQLGARHRSSARSCRGSAAACATCKCAHSVCMQRAAGLLAARRAPAPLGRDQRRIADRRRSTNHTPSGIVVDDAGADLQCEPRLAEPAHAEQRQQPRRAEQRLRSRPARARVR